MTYKLLNPDDVGYDVILLAGQSNQVGYGIGIDTAYLDITDARIWQYAGSGTYLGQTVAAIDPLFHHEQKASSVGHAMSFAREYVRTIPANRRVLLVPCAHGSTGFTTTSSANGCWDPAGGYSATNLYEFAIAQANAAIAINSKNRIAAILWHQGEADGTLSQSAYAGKLDALITGFRSRITGATTVPVLIGQMLDAYVSANSATMTAIQSAHIDTPRRQTRAAFYYGPKALTDSTYQNGDNTHYSAKGQRILGWNAGQALPLARANVTGTAPGVPDTPSLTQSGTSVTATWARPTARFTDFNVQYSVDNGVTWAQLTRIQNLDVTATITGLTLGATVKVAVRSVNEQGNSAWSTVGTLTLATIPSAPTVTAGTPSSSGVPLSWPAVAGATSYAVQYKRTADSTWTTGPTTTGTSVTVSPPAFSTQYDFQVAAVNAAGQGSWSATAQATTVAFSGVIDAVGVSAHQAYGLRLLRGAYTGSAIRVRRSSDNTETDIGFVGAALDTATLLAFAGSGSAYVKTWYDQSGNARDRTQATTANQPRIVNAGTLDAVNSLASLFFDGTNSYFFGTITGLYAAGAASMLAVQKSSPTGALRAMFGEGGSGNPRYFPIQYDTSGKPTTFIRNDSAVNLVNAGASSVGQTGALATASFVDTGTTVASWINGTAALASTAYTRSGTLTITNSAIGAAYSSGIIYAWSGNISEIVLFAAALTDPQRQAGETNQRNYYGTP